MLIHELTQAECLDVVARSHLCRLACARDGQPYIVPVLYSFDSGRNCLYVFSSVGQKVVWMRESPKVCVELEDVADTNHWTTVLIFGHYEEILDSSEEADARDRAQKLFQQRSEWWLPGAGKLASQEHHAVVIFRIGIARMTGRRAARDRV